MQTGTLNIPWFVWQVVEPNLRPHQLLTMNQAHEDVVLAIQLAPPAFAIGSVFHSQRLLGHEHMGLGAGAEVRAVDSYMPLIVASRGQGSTFMPVTRKWFFSLTPAAVATIQAGWDTTGSIS